MAKETQTSELEDEFYEALPQAGEFKAPIDLDHLGEAIVDGYFVAKDWFKKAASHIKTIATEVSPFARAVVIDTDHYGRIAIKTATSKKAARIYQVVAITATVAAATAFAFLARATYALYASDLANPTALLAKKNVGTTILDRNGQVLYRVYGANNSSPIHLQDMPAPLVQATLTAEDPNFYNHDGVSFRATARAVLADLTEHGKVQGGSTITQQLVKNALLTANKSYIRKGQEIILATELERRYSKDQILEMYLNRIYYGQGSTGIESASQTYFHKPAKDLNLSESALLAGLPLCPSSCDPNLDLATATGRRNYILQRMQELGKITPDEEKAAEAEPIAASAQQIEIHAPHFVFYVLDQLKQTYGEDQVEHGGITVYTTLDLKKQEAAQAIVQQQIKNLAGHHATNGGLIALDPTNGQILTMVGSVDYNAPGFGNVNVTQSDLQPGSSIKPIIYADAFTKGWNGATTVDDLPISLPDGVYGVYRPQDYDGKWRGKNIRLRRALSNSLNIPALHVIQFTGIHDAIAMAHSLGITTLNDESRYGVSLVLGGGEVKPIDMAAAYSAFANGGNRITPTAIMKVQDRYGNDITKTNKNTPQHTLDPRIGYMITNILSDNGARAEEFGPNSPLKLSRTSAAKTGTTNDFRDNWTVGYTPDLVTAVWVGNNDHTAMYNVDGITGAAPIWHNFMEMALKGQPDKPFPRPAGLVILKVCANDGGLMNPWDQGGIDEVFLAEAPQTKHCTSAPPPPAPDATKPDDKQNGIPVTPAPNPIIDPLNPPDKRKG